MNALVGACASRVWLMKAYMIPALRPFKSIPEVEGETSLSRMLSCLALRGRWQVLMNLLFQTLRF